MENISVTPFNVGYLRFDLSEIYNLPDDHPFAGQVADIPMFSFHIGLPGRSVRVDAVDYDLQEIPPAFQVLGYEPPADLLQQLEAKRIDAAEISDVIITHAHFDHYGALSAVVSGRRQPAFPRARHYLSKADWHPKRFDAMDERTLGLVEQHGLLALTRGEISLGDGLTILPMPGETPGHQVLCLEVGTKSIYFAGDLYHHPLEFVDAARNVSWASVKKMGKSKLAFMKSMAGSGGLAYFTHIMSAHRVDEQEAGTHTWQRADAAVND